MAATPVHFKKENKKEVKVEDLLVDIGAANAAEVQAMGVGLGDLAVPRGGFAVLNDTILVNKAWDDRVGVAAMVAVLQQFPGPAASQYNYRRRHGPGRGGLPGRDYRGGDGQT